MMSGYSLRRCRMEMRKPCFNVRLAGLPCLVSSIIWLMSWVSIGLLFSIFSLQKFDGFGCGLLPAAVRFAGDVDHIFPDGHDAVMLPAWCEFDGEGIGLHVHFSMISFDWLIVFDSFPYCSLNCSIHFLAFGVMNIPA